MPYPVEQFLAAAPETPKAPPFVIPEMPQASSGIVT
jgi:hypothetical protein